MSTKRLNIDILAKDKTRQALSGVQKNLSNVKNTVFSLKGALVGLGAGVIIKSFVNVGKEVESLQVRFKFLFGSVEEGSLAFDNLTKFASKVPFSLEEISRASGNLAVVADDANDLNRILEITGNVAAVTGLDFETTASQIQRAFSGGIGAADLFRERGVRALLGFKQGATVTAEETVARFEELFSGNGQFAKATDDLSQTLEGTLSMIGDKYFKFQKDVAAGFFDELKGEFGDLNTFLEENEEQIKDIATAIGENFAGAITTTSELLKDIAPTVKTIADNLVKTVDGFNSLPPFVKETGLIAALFLGKKGYAALGSVSFLIGEMREVIKESAGYTGIINVDEIDNVKDLKEELKVLEEQKDALIKAGTPIIGDPATMDLEARQLQTIQTNIDNVTKKIKILNALDIEMGDAYAYAQTTTSSVNEELFKVRELQNEINNQLERENLLRLSNTDALREFKEKYDPITAVIEEAQNEQIALNKLINDGVITADQAARARIQIENELSENLQKIYEETSKERIERIREEGDAVDNFLLGFKESMEEANNINKQFEEFGSKAFNGFADTLTDAIMTGKASFKDFARSILADLLKIIIRQRIALALQKAFEVGRGISGGGGIIGSIGKVLGFADGGRPPINRPSIVGERGAELFVPDTAGTIIPNNEIKGMGGTTNINFTINTVDAQGVDELLTNRRSTIINVINDALNRQGKEALV